MSRKRNLTLGLILALSLSLLVPAACSQPASSPAPGQSPTAAAKPAATVAPIVLRLSSYNAPAHVAVKLIQRYADAVKERTKGRVEIKVFPGESLVSAREDLRALSQGTIDMAALLSATVAGEIKDFGAEGLPFIGIDASRNAFMWYAEAALPLEDAALAKFNVKRLQIGYTDYRNVFTTKKQVKVLADLKGMKLRVSGRWQEKLGEAKYWDFGAVALPAAEQYMALQRGTVDGMITTVEAYIGSKIYEVAPYVTVINQAFAPQRISINLDSWKKIPADLQKIMTDTGKEATAWAYEVLETATIDNLKKAEGLGSKIYVLPKDERVRWVASVVPLWEEYLKEVPEGKPWIELFKQAQTK